MISATVLSKDSAHQINATLESLAWVSEVVLLDTGSSDATLEIAATFPNLKIHNAPFTSFGELKNQAADLACHDWILNIDSDEVLSPELIEALRELVPDPSQAYRFPRRNFLNNKRIRSCGWQSDRVVRLYHRQHSRFSADRVHETIQAPNITDIPHPIDHTSYTSIHDFLAKMQLYSSLWAQQHHHRGSSLFRALLHKWGTFLKCYLLKFGFRDGFEGYLISIYNAHTAFYKYLKLRESALHPPSDRTAMSPQ